MSPKISNTTKVIRFTMVESFDLDKNRLEKLKKIACGAKVSVMVSKWAEISQIFYFFCDFDLMDKIYPVQKYANETSPFWPKIRHFLIFFSKIFGQKKFFFIKFLFSFALLKPEKKIKKYFLLWEQVEIVFQAKMTPLPHLLTLCYFHSVENRGPIMKR